MGSHFKGRACIRLDSLHFESGRAIDDKNVKRLICIFRTEGCHQYDPMNSIPVIMNAEVLASALHTSGLNSAVLYTSATSSPRLDLPSGVKVTCLHGKHRVQAGMKFLKPSQQWWNVKIYDEGLPLHDRKCMQEEYANSLEFSDGDIFKYLVNAERSGDECAVKRWSARLNKWDKKNFNRLVVYDGGRFFSAFERLLPFSAFWSAFDWGALDRIFSMHCYEEIYCYLETLLQQWTGVLGTELAPECLDVQTVECLELKMPAHSRHDATAIHTQMRNRKLFPALLDSGARQKVEKRLLQCRRILTMQTFFDDTMFLRGCFEGLRSLIPAQPFEQSLRETFHKHINHQHQDFLLRYILLCVFSLRNFLYLSEGQYSDLRQRGRQKKKYQQVSDIKLGQLASLAAFVGFESDRIDQRMAQMDENWLPESASSEIPALSDDQLDLPKGARANRPYEEMYHWYRDHLFLEKILQIQPTNEPPKTYATPFAVVRDVVFCFWAVCPFEKPIGIAQADKEAHSSQVANTMTSLRAILKSSGSPARASSSVYSPSACTQASSSVARGREVWSLANIINMYDHPFYEDNNPSQRPEAQNKHQSLLWNRSTPLNMDGAELTLMQAPPVTTRALAENEAQFTIPPTLETSQQQEQQRSETLAMVVDDARDILPANTPPGPSRVQADGQKFTNMGMLVPTNSVVAIVSPLDYTSIENRRQALRISEASSRSTELCDGAFEAEILADPIVAYPLDHDNDASVNRHSESSQDQQHHAADILIDEAHLVEGHGLEREHTPKKRERVAGSRRESTHAKERRQKKTQTRANRKADQLGQAGDFDSEMRETEEHILSATEVVEEVYDDSLESSSHHETREDGDEQESLLVPNRNRPHTVFPGGQSKRAGVILEDWEAVHAEIALQEQPDLLPSVGVKPFIEDGQAMVHVGSEHDADVEPRQLSPSGVNAAVRSKHHTIFPGPSNEKSSGLTLEQRQNMRDYHVQEHRRRKRHNGDAETVVGRLPSTQPAQIADWDILGVEVKAISSIWNQLDHSRIYVTSTVDVPELDCQLHGKRKRLWSWSKQERGKFQSDMDIVLRQDFVLQLVSSDRHPQGQHYHSASPGEFWMIYFREDVALYWLAVVVPRRRMGESWKKVRRTNTVDA